MVGNKGFSALLFDLDGTLIDSREDIADCANRLRSRRGLEALSLDTIASYIGDGIEALVGRLMQTQDKAQLEEMAGEFRKDYHQHCVVKTFLYPGVASTLAALQESGYAMAVVTNKPERISSRILELLGVGPHFKAVIGGNTCANKKPHPEPLLEACKRLNCPAERAAMVGDSRVDVEAGRNAGLLSVAIKGGIGDEAAMLKAGPGLVLDSFAQLLEHFGETL